MVYSSEEIAGISETEQVRSLEVRDPLQRDDLTLEYRIYRVQIISSYDLHQYVSNLKATSLEMPQDAIRLLDCVVKNVIKGDFVTFGRSNALYTKNPERVVSDKLFSIHKGFVASVRPQWKVRITVDMVGVFKILL